jgi:hypothetical protein
MTPTTMTTTTTTIQFNKNNSSFNNELSSTKTKQRYFNKNIAALVQQTQR